MINRILNLIDASNMSDSAICKELSIGNGIIGKWRKGLQKPSTEAIIKIAQYFNVSTDYLLGLSSNPCPKETKSKITDEDAHLLETFHELSPDDKRIVLGKALDLKRTANLPVTRKKDTG